MVHSFKNFRNSFKSFKVVFSFQTNSTDRVLGKMGLGVPESVLVEYQVIDIKYYWCFSSFFLEIIDGQNQIQILQDAFASFDKGGNGMVPTKVLFTRHHLQRINISFLVQNKTTKDISCCIIPLIVLKSTQQIEATIRVEHFFKSLQIFEKYICSC